MMPTENKYFKMNARRLFLFIEIFIGHNVGCLPHFWCIHCILLFYLSSFLVWTLWFFICVLDNPNQILEITYALEVCRNALYDGNA